MTEKELVTQTTLTQEQIEKIDLIKHTMETGVSKITTIESLSENVMKASRDILRNINDFLEMPKPMEMRVSEITTIDESSNPTAPPRLDALAQISENLNLAEICLKDIQLQFARLKARIRN